MAKRQSDPPPLESREFRSADEIDAAIARLRRRIDELENLDVEATVFDQTGADQVVVSNVRATIREVFGSNSPEFREHQYVRLWGGPQYIDMDVEQVVHGKRLGRTQLIAMLNGLIGRLDEKKMDFAADLVPGPSTYLDHLNLHPRIRDVARGLFLDGHHWEAVFAAAKALVNYVKERSNRHDLDGASLMRTVFSKNAPILAFNDLANPTDLDEQEGIMHMFEGAVQAIRNPGGHAFPEGPDQRAIEYISFLSLLAYRVQEAKRLK